MSLCGSLRLSLLISTRSDRIGLDLIKSDPMRSGFDPIDPLADQQSVDINPTTSASERKQCRK